MIKGNFNHYNKLRKIEIARDFGICDRCPWHKVENYRRRPRTDRYKNVKRDTIRKDVEVMNDKKD